MERKDRFLEIGSSSSSASSPSLERKRGSGDESPDVDFDHDVFISFRGEDTRTNFTSHVYDALCRKQIKAFIDSKDLRKGHEVRGSLLKAIEMSKVYLIIFSPDYGSSRWCLMELEKIFQCSKQPHGKKMVIPVFYKVEPTDVRHQTGSFKDAFIEHEAEEEKEKVLEWRVALKEVAGLSGFPLKEHKLETEFINEIVAAIRKEFPLPTPSKGLVGIDPYIEEVLSLLRVDEVRSVGIWGMGGIGKTTIAEVVFHRIDHAQFDGHYFLKNVREKIERNGGDVFWNSVLSEILGMENCCTRSLSLSFEKQRLGRKRILIVFDDVDDSIILHLKDLAEHHGLFGVGSKILMTSRDRHVLTKLSVDEVCEVRGLQDEEALKLFSLKAFKKESPPVKYVELSNRVVCYTRGNPLALIVLGLDLLNRDRKYWDEALHKMNIFHDEILKLLRISYEGLSRKEKDVFLDIVCFFKNENKDHVESLYESAGVHTIIIRLIDKSLITISQKKSIEVHDLLQEMGLKIDDEEEVTDDSGKRKRLHKSDDIYRVLTGKNVVTGAIQGISLNLSEAKTMNFGVDAFAGMVNLRWLIVYGQNDQVCLLNAQRMRRFWWLNIFGTNYELFLPQMKYLYWEAFPLQSLSSTFNVQNLVKLNLPGSKVERLWSGVPDVVNLRWMDLSHSHNLTETPDLSKAKNLESMLLRNCKKLTRLHPSVQYLKKLQILRIDDCSNLREIPSMLESEVLKTFTLYFCKKIKEWPKFYGNKLEVLGLTASDMNGVPDFSGFRCLEILVLFACPNITKFPEPEMLPGSSLEFLLMGNTGVEEVPSSVQFLTVLQTLYLTGNHKLRSISDSISILKSLRHLCISGCKLLSFIPVLPTSLGHLDVMDCPSLETVSPISSQSQLQDLWLLGCGKLDHQSLTNIKGHISFKAKLQQWKDFLAVIQGSEISEWFPHQNVHVGSSITLRILTSHLDDFYPGFAIIYVLEYNPLYVDDKNYLRLKLKIRAHPQTDNQDLPPAETELNFDILNLSYTFRPRSDLVVLRWTPHPFQLISSDMLSPKYSSMSFQFTPSLPQLKVKQCSVYLAI